MKLEESGAGRRYRVTIEFAFFMDDSSKEKREMVLNNNFRWADRATTTPLRGSDYDADTERGYFLWCSRFTTKQYPNRNDIARLAFKGVMRNLGFWAGDGGVRHAEYDPRTNDGTLLYHVFRERDIAGKFRVVKISGVKEPPIWKRWAVP